MRVGILYYIYGSFSFVIVPKRRPGNLPIFLLKSLLKGKIAWAPTFKTASKRTKKEPPYGPFSFVLSYENPCKEAFKKPLK